MKEDAEIIIGVDVDTKKIDKELEKILDQYSKKKIELDLELKNQSNIRKSLVELDHLMNKLGIPSDEIKKEFDKLSISLSDSAGKVFKLKEELKSLGKEYKDNLKIIAYKSIMEKLSPNKQIAGLLPSNVKRYINVEIETNPEKFKKKLNGIDQILREYSNKKIQLDFQLNENSKIKSQLKNLGSGREFDALKSKLIESTSITSQLREEVKLLGKQYRISFSTAIIEASKLNNYILSMHMLWQKYRNWQGYSVQNNFKLLPNKQIAGLLPANITKVPIDILPKINTKNIESQVESSSNVIGNIKDKMSRSFNFLGQSISGFFDKIKYGFSGFKANTLSASYHVDYFSRRIFNLLRNAFVFNVISRQFRGLSSLLGNLINRDAIFARTLMLVRANLVRAFAPIWQVILPWIRLLGEGLLWLSKILINFINWLTGSKIKPVETFKEAKSVVGDFYKIASPKKEMFNLVDPAKKIKNIKDGTKNVSKNTSKAGNNAKKLSKGLKKSAKESENILASFDKLEVLKFDKNKLSKDPFGLDEIKNKLIDEPSNSNIPADFEVNVPSIEDQIADAINNIEDKPLNFTVNDDIGDQITSQINGLELPPLDFEVSEESQSLVDNFKKKIIEFYNWIKPLIDAVSKFFGKVWESLQDTFSEIQKNPAVKWMIDKITGLKDNLVKMFNAMSENEGTIKTFRDIIIAIGAAFITYSIIKSVQKLFRVISSIGSLLMGGLTSPTGWVVIAVAALALIITHWEDIKKVAGEAWDKVKEFGDFLKGGFLNAWDTISTKISDVFESIKEFATKTWGWIDEHIISPIKNAFGFGNMFGNPNFKSQSITNLPHLAQGSILRGGDPFLTWINDQPRGQTNVEAPLNTIVDAFRQAMSEGSFGQSNINIEASGDMSSIVRLLNFKIHDENSRLGNAFVENIN